MLVVDLNTLESVNALYFLDHVILYGSDTLDLQDVMRINRTLGELVARLDDLSVHNLDP